VTATAWPFRPNHITNDGETLALTGLPTLQFGSTSRERAATARRRGEDLGRLNGTGIISNAYLEGMQAMICARLGNPTTIVEFSPKGEPVCTDSKLLSFAMHQPCRLFRRYTDERLCLESDSIHACLFCGLSREGIAEALVDRADHCEYIKRYRGTNVYFAVVRDPDRTYLEYDCPFLGYRELLFPIFFEDRVIATFSVDQLCLISRRESILASQMRFFESQEEERIGSCMNGCRIEDVGIEVCQAHQEWSTDASNLLADDHYGALVETAKRQLLGLEDLLRDQMQLQRVKFIRRHIDDAVTRFREGLPIEDMPGSRKWTLLWKNTAERLSQLVDDFAFEYVVVFAGGGYEAEEREPLLCVVANAGNLPANLRELIDKGDLRFDLRKVSENLRHLWTTSAEDERILMGVDACSGMLNRQRALVRLFPVPFFPQATLAVLVGYREDNPLTSVENGPHGDLSIALQGFYAVVLSALSATLASLADERRDRALGRLTHEFEVPIIAIRGATQSIMDTPGVSKLLKQDYPGDIWSWTDLMGRLIDNADVYRYMHTGTLEIVPTRVFLLTDVIAPAIRQIKLLLDERHFSPKALIYRGFEQLPALWLDRNRFQQAIFNLLSNAVKYAFHDPAAFRIEIEGKKYDGGFQIYARDWGSGIEAGYQERVFEEEFRGGSALQNNVAGQGLGLWIVRNIILRHGGRIVVSSLRFPTEFEITLPYWLASRGPD
jgi:signal transduction histidine kinase